ncbi:uncharacterized protein LOC131612821 isoform X2 [Vicia villosa]|nr:uncharacterized protein LOC131612821 isoform X2 [Vicia villosa]
MTTNVDISDSKLWPDFVTKAFIDIMVDEVTKGNMPNGVFHNRTWTSMTTRLSCTTNRSFKAGQLKAKMHRLRSMYREFYSLLQNTGFGWNAETNTVTASEEVWRNYLKVHDKASQFQKKGCDHYKLLEIIFNKNNATGVLHHSSTQDPPNTDEENELDNQYLNNGSACHVRVDNDSSDDDLHEVEHITRSGKKQVQVRSRKESTSHMMGEALSAWAKASLAKADRYRDRSVEATSRVYSGWEGSAHDSKILLDAITNQNAGFPWPPRGSFYLVDSGYPCIGGFLPPYRGERYHAQEYRGQGRQPRSPEELFNYRHSSLRMTIERCFGVLKNRFPILKLMPPYKPSRQRLIVIACCAIHNYIRKWNLPDELFRIWEEMDPIELEGMPEGPVIEGTSSNVDNLTRLSNEGAAEMAIERNHIRDEMWVHRNN